jgi:hypothetical protein
MQQIDPPDRGARRVPGILFPRVRALAIPELNAGTDSSR